MKIKDLLLINRKKLQGFSSTSSLDVETLLSSVLKKNREFLFSHFDYKVLPKKIQLFNNFIERRITQEPVAYIIEEKNFYGRTFQVTQNTLIPRPETELLIEKTLEYFHREFYPSQKSLIIDIGTGSGCIPITLIKELRKGHFKESIIQSIGVDISAKALKIARKNSKKLGTSSKIKFLESDLLQFLSKKNSILKIITRKEYKNSQMIITANLPYLSSKVYSNCPNSVINFEPKKALIADRKGLEFYLKLLKQVKKYNLPNLTQNLYLIFEISPEQKKLAENEFRKIFPNIKIKFSKDLAQKWRFIEIFF